MATPQRRSSPKTARRLGPLRALLGSRLLGALTYPQSVHQYLQLSSKLWSVDAIRAEVVEVRRETPDVVTLALLPNENFRGHAAGQYVAVTVEIDGVRHTRCFSISSAPECADGLLTLTVKSRAEGGLVSPYLLRHAAPGMRLELSTALGDFVLPAELPSRLLFISGGSGITPCMSMLRSLAARGYAGEILFVHYARSSADVIFGNELREFAGRLGGLRLVVETERELGHPPALDASGLAALANDFDAWDCWVCGPSPLMDAVQGAYAARGASDRVRHERFVIAPGPAGPPGRAEQAGALTFLRSRSQTQGDARTLLEQAETAGLRPQSGCRMGICQTCRCRKVSGVTRDVNTGALSTEADDDIRLCVSVPVGDVALDL